MSEYDLDPEFREYVEYIENAYHLISRILVEKDKVADATKRHMFFDKFVTPFYYWKQEHSSSAPTSKNPAALLANIKKKYDLEATKSGFKFAKYMPQEQFKELAQAMTAAGFVYNRNTREFEKVIL